MIPRTAEINGGIDICGKRLKFRFQAVLPFFYLYAKVDRKIFNGAKFTLVLARRLVLDPLTFFF